MMGLLNAAKNGLKRPFRPAIAVAYDTLAMQMLRGFDFGYLPWTAASMRPAGICAILNEIGINRRRQSVELGCGISTLYIASLLRQHGGQLISFEHDVHWGNLVNSLLEKNGLATTAVVFNAPLTSNVHAIDSCHWYQADAIESALKGKAIDGLVVDGPPASGKSRAFSRYPAVPAIKEFFSDSFFVYLDDISRPAEAEILQKWGGLLSLPCEIEKVAGQYGMLRRGAKFAVTLNRDS